MLPLSLPRQVSFDLKTVLSSFLPRQVCVDLELSVALLSTWTG